MRDCSFEEVFIKGLDEFKSHEEMRRSFFFFYDDFCDRIEILMFGFYISIVFDYFCEFK